MPLTMAMYMQRQQALEPNCTNFNNSSILSKILIYWKWLYALDVYIELTKNTKFKGDFS